MAPQVPPPPTHAETLGRHIRALREANDWDLQELADRMPESRSTAWRHETGRTMPKDKTIERYADVLGVPVEALMASAGRVVDVESFQETVLARLTEIAMLLRAQEGRFDAIEGRLRTFSPD